MSSLYFQASRFTFKDNKSKFIRPGKNFGSGQLIFENWSGGPVEVFFFGTTTYIFQILFFNKS